jgi:hypothetical protein
MDDLVFTVGGAIVGIVGQLAIDGITKHQVSSTRDIIAAGVGGAMTAWSALYTVPTMGPGALYVAGGIGGAATNLAGQAYDSFFDPNKGFDGARFAYDTAVGVATGIIPRGVLPILMPTIAGVNAGGNSFNAIFNQITTKAMTGQISSVTFETATKMFLAKAVDAAFLNGALVSSVSGFVFDNFIEEAHAETAPANQAVATGSRK